MSQTVRPYNIRTEIWIASADPANRLFRRITPRTEPVVQRTDPEVFITDKGPLIYFNSFTPEHPVQRTPELVPESGLLARRLVRRSRAQGLGCSGHANKRIGRHAR